MCRMSSLLLVVALALAPGCGVLRAQELQPQPVYRCLGPGGSILFSGTPCRDDSLARGVLPERAAAGSGPPLHLCPLDADELRARVADAFLTHDVNRLSGLMLWRGYDAQDARARLQALAVAMRAGLTGITLEDDAPAAPLRSAVPDGAGTDGPASPSLAVQLDDGTGLRFAVERDHGCWWLLP